MGNKNSAQKGGKDATGGDIMNQMANSEGMNPIVFDTINSTYENSSGYNASVSRFSNVSKNSGIATNKSATKYEAQLNLNNLSVIMENQEFRGSKDDASVPFSVVKLSIEPNTKKCIDEKDPEFLDKLDRIPLNGNNLWKINSKGFYFRHVD